jgi:D-lactate dehydrogenase (cytochrome)
MIKKTDQSVIKGFLEDSSNLLGGFADGVYLPESETDIIEAVKECNDKKTPLTVSAGETGTTGGCIPFGGWLLSTQKLNKIIAFNPNEKSAVVQPGVTLEEIESTASKAGLLYPPDPTEKSATIGGNVATNAAGGRSFRFGATRNWIKRIRVVLPNGTSLNIKRGIINANKNNELALPNYTLRIPQYNMPNVKNAAGYFSQPGMDLVDLFIGAEGTLGIVSEIEIALASALQETFDLVAFFSTEELAVDFVLDAKKKNDKTINFFEFFDQHTLQMLKKSYPHIPAKAQAAVYIEQEITPDNENFYLESWAKSLKQFKASLDNCWLGADAAQKAELAKFRYAVPEHINEIFKQHHLIKLATDIAVPADNFNEMFEYYKSQLPTSNIKTNPNREIFNIKFGHIGENHLHVNLVPQSERAIPLAKEILLKFVRKAVSLGGTVSAEHGIGKIKHDYLRELYSQAGIDEMRRIKKMFDPNLILGSNNIFPRS